MVPESVPEPCYPKHARRWTMDSIKLWARNGEAVRQAIELGEIAHIETASEELTDEFLLFAIESGLLKSWAGSFPEPRCEPEIAMEVILPAHIAARFAGLYSLRQDWSTKVRTRWRTHQRRLLMRGEVAQVITAVRDLCRGRNSKAIRKHREYFIKNQHRMAYAQLMALKLPIGSGAIESAVRRVVNLRLKGPSLFWC